MCNMTTQYSIIIASTSLHDLDDYAMQIQATKKGSIVEVMKLLDGGHDPNLCEESKVCTALCDIYKLVQYIQPRVAKIVHNEELPTLSIYITV